MMPLEMAQALVIGARNSPLAVVQARQVMAQVQAHCPSACLHLETFVTQGDRLLDAKLAQLGADKGFFVKELEQALLDEKIDVAVHSLKDMPALDPPGLALLPVGPREDARDVCLAMSAFADLSSGATVGTASLRRVAQLEALRPDLVYLPIRGNLNTRLRKLQAGDVQALILAAAGVHRLGWHHVAPAPHIHLTYFDPQREVVPAPGQGILAAQFRRAGDDSAVQHRLGPLVDAATMLAFNIERTLLQAAELGCSAPLGAYFDGTTLHVRAYHPTTLAPVFAHRAALRQEAGGDNPGALGQGIGLAIKAAYSALKNED